MKLYDIPHKFQDALAKLESAQTEAEHYETEVELSAIDAPTDDRLTAYCAYFKNLRAEISELKDRLQHTVSQADRFERFLNRSLSQGEPWALDAHSIGWRKSKRVMITSEDDIPSAYKVEHISYTPDKVLLKQDLECGAVIPGATIKEFLNLNIK